MRLYHPLVKRADLRKEENIISLLKDEQPNVVIHCAAAVGGIGANRDNPGSFFYEKLNYGNTIDGTIKA
ncbi:MAG: NAD-dependent epimerase/dehydratase family protein [Enterocloster sp.]